MSDLNPLIRLMLFLSSFVPLWLTLVFFFWASNQAMIQWDLINVEFGVFLFLVCMTVIPALFAVVFIRKMKTSKTEKKTIVVWHHSNLTKEFLLYFVTYTIPFILHDAFGINDLVAILIFMCAVGIIYLKSDLVFVNPLFAFMNYRLHCVVDKKNSRYYILTKRDIFNDNEIKTVRIDRYFYLEQGS